MEHLKMQTANGADENYRKLAELFPNAVTETINENGEVVRAIDKDILQQEINAHVVEGREERYQFTWPDKKKAMVLANEPITKTLRPCIEESVGRDGTPGKFDSENLYIEGDNLEVLKCLRDMYPGGIKMIYIDPPYNTGNDFIFRDNYSTSQDKYKLHSGQLDESNNRMFLNGDNNGRFHTDWLNMIYPRLILAKNFLAEEGAIFISIDDSELKNLRNICEEIFGNNNFVAQIIWQNKKGGGNDSRHIAVEHEYILVYAKDKAKLKEFYERYSDDYSKRYKEKDEKGKFFWDTFKRKSGKQYYPITCPDGTILQYDEDGNPISWLRSRKRFISDVKDNEIRFVDNNGKWSVQFKQRMPEGKKPRSLFVTEQIVSEHGTTSSGSDDIYMYFKKHVFSNPKPVDLVSFFLDFVLQEDDIILDFFSGSGTTAEAVMKLNNSDKNYKYILVQVPESIEPMLNSPSENTKLIAQNAISVLDDLHKQHILTELAKERIRRAGKKIKEETGKDIDYGFRVLKCDSSNMRDVFYTPDKTDLKLLEMMTDNVKKDRTPEDLLFQIMLEMGIDLSMKIEKMVIDGKNVFSVGDGFLLACFDQHVTDETVTAIAKLKPTYFVMRDGSADSDSTMTNFDQIFNIYSPETTRKVL